MDCIIEIRIGHEDNNNKKKEMELNREERYLNDAKVFYSEKKFSSAGMYARKVLRRNPEQCDALMILGHLAVKNNDLKEADRIFSLIIALIPNYFEAISGQLCIAEKREDFFAAYRYLVTLVELMPENHGNWFKLGITASKIGLMDEAEKAFNLCHNKGSVEPSVLLNLGHVCKAKGDTAKAAEFYHNYIKAGLDHQAVGYWSLADLKNYSFTDTDAKSLKNKLESAQYSNASRSLFLFAQSRVFEQKHDYEQSFTSISEANQLMQELRPFKAGPFSHIIDTLLECTPVKKDKYQSSAPQQTPIFIVGMPRSGTTLTEQILASHSLVEATDELPYMERLALELDMSGGYAKWLARLTDEKLDSLRRQYLSQVAQYFESTPEYFIDKNPNNFLHIGLIKTLFPDAKIVNVIRDANDNAMGVFKQHFSRGHDYSYSLDDIVEYWKCYVELMKHWTDLYAEDIYHLSFERLVHSPDDEIAKLLNYCGLSFEEQCLTFYQSKRTVLTPSASQVRQPMNPKAIGQSQKYQDFMGEHFQQLAGIAEKVKSEFLS